MKITIEINDINELIKLRDWLNEIHEFEYKPEFDLTKSIDVLNFTLRTMDCLRSENINTVGELIKFSSLDILRLPNIGRKTIREIEDKLSSVGLSLKSE